MRYLLWLCMTVSIFSPLTCMDAPPLSYKDLKIILSPTLNEEYHKIFNAIQLRIDHYYSYSVTDIYKQYLRIQKFCHNEEYSPHLQLFKEQRYELRQTIERILHIYPDYHPNLALSGNRPQLYHKHRKIVRSLNKILNQSKVSLKKGKREFLHTAWKQLGSICSCYETDSKERKFLVYLRQKCAHRLYKELFCS